jgi:ClpX C4-type zinc finger
MRPVDALKCSFCHKTQDEVLKLICSPSESPRVYICDECVTVCLGILQDDALHPPPIPGPNLALVDTAIRVLRRLAENRQPHSGDLATLRECSLPEDANLDNDALATAIILREVRKRPPL